ncbi:baseplate J/gp47 family protein [Shewanella psychrotolerans]|uniref:baseplate J/gp47 family protein n=1 Tax=Shewanella psychrotolerans TaxID=2864206 RepID=UPI001C661A95|nr:baseplate J/gp47 family protein [Shewanella psychrotolerans]QYK02450.1 baseplate J/gp47 family protein [Shewanella psychrotolerans]
MPRPQVDFEKVLENEGVPTTKEGVAALLDADVVAANSIISNDSAMSPFWRLFSACVVTPVLWLIKTLLANHVLPAMFAATATEFYLELKAWDVGLERKPAVKTQGNIGFTKTDINSDVVVEAGTVVQTDKSLGAIYRLLVLADTIIPAGTLSAKVLCEADVAGAGHNLGAGYYHVLPIAITGIDSVTNVGEWITQTGADKETDDELALRIRDQFSSVGNYHIDAVYRAAISSFAGIRSDWLYFEHEAPRGPGTANCHVMMGVGETPQSMIDDINNYISTQGNHGHGDDLRAMAIAAAPVDLSLEFWHAANLSVDEIATLQGEIESRVRAAFRESDMHSLLTRTKPQSVFAFSVLNGELHRDLPNLKSVRWANNDIVIGLELPRINSLIITNRGVA